MKKKLIKSMLGALAIAGVASIFAQKIRYHEPKTFAHLFLDAEQWPSKKNLGHYDALNSLLARAEEQLPSLQTNSVEQAKNILSRINDFLREEGYSCSGSQQFLSAGLETKKLDCDTTSVLYAGFAERKRYPLEMVYVPGHVLVRWKVSPQECIYWETTSGRKYSHYGNHEYLYHKDDLDKIADEINLQLGHSINSRRAWQGLDPIHITGKDVRILSSKKRFSKFFQRYFSGELEYNVETYRGNVKKSVKHYRFDY